MKGFQTHAEASRRLRVLIAYLSEVVKDDEFYYPLYRSRHLSQSVMAPVSIHPDSTRYGECGCSLGHAIMIPDEFWISRTGDKTGNPFKPDPTNDFTSDGLRFSRYAHRVWSGVPPKILDKVFNDQFWIDRLGDRSRTIMVRILERFDDYYLSPHMNEETLEGALQRIKNHYLNQVPKS